MSPLQLSLIGLGVGIMVAVAAYNAYITRVRAPRHVEKPNEPKLPLDPRLEAMLITEPAAQEATGDGEDLGVRWDLPAATLSVPVGPTEARGHLDHLIDVITPLNLDHPISGDFVLAAMPPSRRVGTKPFAVEGRRQDSTVWEHIQLSQEYVQLQAGLQLANRSGPINDIEFSEYIVKTQGFADVISAQPDFPDMMTEVARARELDQFASEHDAQLNFTIRSGKAVWSVGYVQSHAAKMGFVPGSLPGKMVLQSTNGGVPMLTLRFDPQAAMADDSEQASVHELRMELDVTHVASQLNAYNRMRNTAIDLAAAMDGVLTDDSGARLTPEALDQIGTAVNTLYTELAARDLAAGSPLARRLFS
jgi:hypothetical protein